MESLEKLFNDNSNRIFTNSKKEQYYQLLTKVFENSQKNVNWVIANSQKFLDIFSEQLIEKIKNKSKQISINIVCTSPKVSDILKNIQNLNLKLIDKKLEQEFITWDDHGYRFVPNSKKFMTVTCINDPEFTGKCNHSFQNLIDSL